MLGLGRPTVFVFTQCESKKCLCQCVCVRWSKWSELETFRTRSDLRLTDHLCSELGLSVCVLPQAADLQATESSVSGDMSSVSLGGVCRGCSLSLSKVLKAEEKKQFETICFLYSWENKNPSLPPGPVWSLNIIQRVMESLSLPSGKPVCKYPTTQPPHPWKPWHFLKTWALRETRSAAKRSVWRSIQIASNYLRCLWRGGIHYWHLCWEQVVYPEDVRHPKVNSTLRLRWKYI